MFLLYVVHNIARWRSIGATGEHSPICTALTVKAASPKLLNDHTSLVPCVSPCATGVCLANNIYKRNVFFKCYCLCFKTCPSGTQSSEIKVRGSFAVLNHDIRSSCRSGGWGPLQYLMYTLHCYNPVRMDCPIHHV